MKDIDLAKEWLRNNNNALVIVKDGLALYQSTASGIQSLLMALDKIGSEMKGSALADRIVGEAAAQLCAYSRVREVYAVILSSCGRDVLERNDIYYEYENMVPHILNMKKTDLCPFEKMVAGGISPQEAYERLRKGLSAPHS